MKRSSRKRRTYDVIVTREMLGIRQKPEKRQRAFPRIRLLSVPILIVLAAILFHLLTASAYQVRGAAVRGNTLIDAQAIYDASMLDGQNLFVVNTQAAARAVKRLPYVKQAWVHTRPPAQVAIVVQEYQPRWVWMAGDNQYWVDETGNVLPYNGSLNGVLTVVDRSGRPLPVGSRLEARLVTMLDVISRLMPNARQITYDEHMGFIVQAGPGWPVRVGESPDRLSDKISLLNSLIPKLIKQNSDVDFIDLRYPERPYYRLK